MVLLPKPTDLILVVVMNEPRDLEIARLLGCYRIPLRSAPKVVAVDFLAFYQTGHFEQNKWRIRYIAPVRGHGLTTRAQLLQDELDHPHALQEYFKIQIGQLIELPKPIPAGKWRRITFFYTTGEYFVQAASINDLLFQNEEHKILWQALRDGANQKQQYISNELPELDIDPSVLATLLGIEKLN